MAEDGDKTGLATPPGIGAAAADATTVKLQRLQRPKSAPPSTGTNNDDDGEPAAPHITASPASNAAMLANLLTLMTVFGTTVRNIGTRLDSLELPAHRSPTSTTTSQGVNRELFEPSTPSMHDRKRATEAMGTVEIPDKVAKAIASGKVPTIKDRTERRNWIRRIKIFAAVTCKGCYAIMTNIPIPDPATRKRANIALYMLLMFAYAPAPWAQAFFASAADGDGHAVWNAFVNDFQSYTLAAVTRLKAKITNIKQGHIESVRDYKARALTQLEDLHAAGASMEASDSSYAWLAGLRSPQFDLIKSILMTTNRFTSNLSLLADRVLEHMDALDIIDTVEDEDSTDASAYSSHSGGGGDRRSDRSNDRRTKKHYKGKRRCCFKCNKYGDHSMDVCRSPCASCFETTCNKGHAKCNADMHAPVDTAADPPADRANAAIAATYVEGGIDVNFDYAGPVETYRKALMGGL